jgi:tetratricopeptide (TPR) repeat protein
MLRAALAILLLASSIGLARAAAEDDRKLCMEKFGPEALAACDRAIESKEFSGPDLARLHTKRGGERRRVHDLDGAIADHTEAIRLNPEDPFPYNNRASAWRSKGDLDRAIADYGEALRVDPGYTAAYVNRGLVYERKNDLDRARADYEQALARPPKYGNGRGGQALARKRLAALGQKM